MNERIEKIEEIRDIKIKKEMIDGQIYLMATPCGEHRDVQANIANLFNEYFKKNKKRCRARIDHELYINEKNTLEPDVKILCRENRSDDIPVIVIEVLSTSTYDRDFGVKMAKYAELGIKEYWIVDWKNCVVNVFLLNENKIYDKHKSYVYYSSENAREYMKLEEEEKKNVLKEFFPLSFPDLTVKLEDVFDIFE